MRRGLHVSIIACIAVALIGCRSAPQTPKPSASQLVESPPPHPLTPLPEYSGRIKHILLHSKSGLVGQAAKPVFDLLSALPEKTRVTILCDDLPACNESRGRMRQYGFFDRHQLEFIKVPVPISVWARDRYIFCKPLTSGAPPFCLVPAITAPVHEAGRENERSHAVEIFSRCRPPIDLAFTPLAFEGGNLLASSTQLYIGANVLTDNAARGNPTDIRDDLSQLFAQPITSLADKSDHVPFIHIDMYVSIIGDNQAIVASPALAAAAMKGADAESQKTLSERLFEKPPDFSPIRQKTFDEISDRLAAAGFKVSRMPYIDCLNGDFIITYNNVLQNEVDGRHIVYMPTYLIAALDKAAQKAWEALGCTVVPIDVSPISHLNGAIRCLVNVVERD
jgi:N-dimethylarginine dimethylaminohydrolase